MFLGFSDKKTYDYLGINPIVDECTKMPFDKGLAVFGRVVMCFGNKLDYFNIEGLQYYMMKKNISLVELSKQSGYKEKDLEKYINGKKKLKEEPCFKVLKLSRCLDCKIEDLI